MDNIIRIITNNNEIRYNNNNNEKKEEKNINKYVQMRKFWFWGLDIIGKKGNGSVD